MNERTRVNMLGPVRQWTLTVGLVAGVVLLFSLSSGAQSTPEKSAPSTRNVVATSSEKPSPAVSAQSPANGKTEGIKVHGHWAIEVRNPDGTVVTHREFENALITSSGGGAQLLANTLGRQFSVGAWELILSNTTSGTTTTTQPCTDTSTRSLPCYIFETGTAVLSNGINFATMSVSVGSTGSLVLSGTATAGENSAIALVQSVNNPCIPSTSPSTCTLGSGSPALPGYAFTSATLASPINVSVGQTVAVTVTFTFA